MHRRKGLLADDLGEDRHIPGHGLGLGYPQVGTAADLDRDGLVDVDAVIVRGWARDPAGVVMATVNGAPATLRAATDAELAELVQRLPEVVARAALAGRRPEEVDELPAGDGGQPAALTKAFDRASGRFTRRAVRQVL